MTEKILEVEDLNKFYGNKQVLHDISFSLNKGEVLTLQARLDLEKRILQMR